MVGPGPGGAPQDVPRGAPGAPRGAPGAPEGCTTFTQTIKNHYEPTGGGEKAAGASPEGAPAAQGGAGEAVHTESLIARWRRLEPTLVTRFGKADWDSWFKQLIPVSDDGETLRLAAPNRFIADWFRSHFAVTVGDMIRRQVDVRHEKWAEAKAYHDKQRLEEVGE
ncbi:MAG: DnaA N-terminal domain-containing protein [Kiloniellales bacterium]